MTPILQIKNLSIFFQENFEENSQNNSSQSQILTKASIDLFSKKITALIGESGSGKSSLGLVILGLLKKAKISGEVNFKGQNLLKLSEKNFYQIRGKEISIIFQDPNTSLNPLHKIGKQLAESIKIHNPKISKKALKEKIYELLENVEMSNFKNRLNDYPHQFSGGQKQRFMIAIAIANNPKILIADEPTTALDRKTQDEILELFKKLKNDLGISILLISHNLNAVKKISDQIFEVKNGEIEKITNIESKLGNLQKKPVKKINHNSEKILDVKNLSVSNKTPIGFFKNKEKFILKNINFSLKKGQNLGIIGQSGSGKSTLAKALINLLKPKGEITFFDNKNWLKDEKFLRKNIQIIFQDPFSSLNPRMTIKEIISEGLIIHKISFSDKDINEILKKLGLNLNLKNRYPHSLSGGQRQRVAIARALILKPKILILDEPTSALDLKTQIELLKLLKEISAENEISYILISHDMDIIAEISDEVLEIENGNINQFANLNLR